MKRLSLACGCSTMLLAVCFLFAGSAVAQVKLFSCTGRSALSIDDATRIVSSVQAAYSKVEASTGDFSQESYLAALDTSEVSSGIMWFQKPGKMRWSYQQPRPQEVVVADDTMWVHQLEQRQVLVDSIKSALLSDLPIAFLMGIGDLSRDFVVKGGCRTPGGTVLSLAPRPKVLKNNDKTDSDDGSSGELAGFDLLVDESAALPKGALVTALGGNVTAIVFSALRTSGVHPPASTFVLEYPKGVDILDRRESE